MNASRRSAADRGSHARPLRRIARQGICRDPRPGIPGPGSPAWDPRRGSIASRALAPCGLPCPGETAGRRGRAASGRPGGAPARPRRPRVASAPRELERAVGEEGRFDPATTRRRFVLACSDGDQIASVPRIATVLAREMPHAQLHVVSIDPLAASDGLAAGTVDGSLSPVGVPTEGLHTEPLYTDEAVVVLRADHPIRSRRLSREQFNSLRHIDVWLVLGRAGVGNQVAAAYFKRHGTVRNVAVIVPGFAAA